MGSKNEKSGGKRTSGGKQNQDTRGSVAENIAKTLAGKLRKKALQKQHDADRARRAVTSTDEEKKAFDIRCSQTSGDLRRIVGEVVGSKVLIVVKDGDVVQGRLILEVFTFYGEKQSVPAVRVLESDYVDIPVIEGMYLQIWKLHSPNNPVTTLQGQKAVVLGKLWQVLKDACMPIFEEQHARAQQKQKIVTPQFGAKKRIHQKPFLDVAKAKKLQGIHLADTSGRWNGVVFFVANDGRGSAYFIREVVAGSQKLTLVRADNEHLLSPLLDEHESVQVDIGNLVLFADNLGDCHIGDLHDIREARKYVVEYLIAESSQIGFRIKAKKGTVTV